MDGLKADSFSAINSRLVELIRLTESSYLNLGTLFPKIIAEMEKSNAESASRAESFGGRRGSDDFAVEAEAIRLVAEARDFIVKSESFFTSMDTGDRDLVEALKQDLERIGALDAMIALIREDSEEMELISLNAMTVALKSGSAGRGFSVITDELKRLSTSTIALTDSLTEYGKKLLALFGEFKDEIATLQSAQDVLFKKTYALMHGNFDNLDTSIKDIAAFLSSLSAESRTVGGPVMGIMQEVQLQDIIRQSTEHVILSLSEIADGSERIERADEIIFMKIMTELATSLLDDVKKKISVSVMGLDERIDSVFETIANLERRRAEWTAARAKSAIPRDEKDRDVKALCDELVAYGRERIRVSRSGDRVSGTVHDLDKQFKRFSDILERFHTIVIASRIEVSKSALLSGMTDTVSQMIVLTERIERDVNAAVEQTKSFIGNSSGFIARYSDRVQDEEPMVRLAAGTIESRFSNLFRVESLVEANIAGFILYTDEFKNLIKLSRHDVSRLGKLIGEINEIERLLKTFHESAEGELEGREAELSGIHNDRLRSIIERFTIFTHKKAAGDIVGFSVESGIESGDITLF